MFAKVIIFTYFLSVRLEKFPLLGILKLKDNSFHNINGFVLKALNKSFKAIKLKVNVTESPNIKMLLIMHNDLSNIAEKNCKIYGETKKSIMLKNQTINTDINIILNEIINQLKNNHTVKDLKNNIVKLTHYDSVESLDFIEDFLNKINNLTVNDFINETRNETRLNDENEILAFRKSRRSKIYNLKVWRPSLSKEMIGEREQTRRIYNGEITRIQKYSFMVSIHLRQQFLCAGSIISKDLVITAASCLQLVYNNKNLRKKPSAMHVRFASDYTKKSGDTIQIKELHFHPFYNSSTLKNNLAVIRMVSSKHLTKWKIRRILYDKDADKPKGVQKVILLGWGATDHVLDPKHSQPLTLDKIDLYDLKKCQDMYSSHYVSEENFCVRFDSKGGGACNGDVGGPGIVNNILLGVISFGSPVCGEPDMPTVFTKLGYYTDWIDSFITYDLPTKRKSKNLRSTKQEYSEKVMILNQLLNKLILSNVSLLDEFLYGDLENDFEDIFNVSTTHDPLQHPLVNKSIFLIPHIHDFGNYAKTETVLLTTSTPVGPTTPHPGFNIEYINDTEERLKMIEYAYPWLTAKADQRITRTTTTTELTTIKYFTDILARTKKEDEIFKDDSNTKVENSKTSDVFSDNYEIESYEGLSIDVSNKQSLNRKKL